MTSERVLVTGASGCIGAWVVRNLVRDGTPTAALDHGSSMHRLRLIMTEEALSQVQFIRGDVAEFSSVEAAVKESSATHIIHLAAMQVPFCKADPPLGARVNVVGTVNVFEAAKRRGVKKVVYASSVAVLGPKIEYPQIVLPHDAPPRPRSHYGFYKQANEGNARVYWTDDGIASVGIRPHVVYGAGRDRGMTSAPSLAILAAAVGRSYMIPFGGRFGFQYADDVAKIFIGAARIQRDGADVFNLGQPAVTVPEIIAAIEAAEPRICGRIEFKDVALPLPEEMDNAALSAFLGGLPETPLACAIADTVRIFSQALADGRIEASYLRQLFGP